MWISDGFVCVVISSSLFYEYMNIFNGHLSQGRFPVDKFPSKGMILLHPPTALPPTLFSLHFIPGKIRTTASVFDYGYFKTKFIFCPLRPKGYICAVAMHDRVMFTEIIFIIIIERPVFLFLFFCIIFYTVSIPPTNKITIDSKTPYKTQHSVV